MTTCKNCNHDLTGPDQKSFCSKSCAASYNNRGQRRNFKDKKCHQCSTSVLSNRKYCRDTCREIGRTNKRLCLVCGEFLKGHRKLYCSNQCRYNNQQRQLVEKLTLGSNLNPKQLRRYLISVHGEICMSLDCAWDFTKKPTTVEVDHIDGNSMNNNPSNLRLICPNCHSQTNTYKGKNRGSGRFSRRQRYQAGLSF